MTEERDERFNPPPPPPRDHILSNRAYDALKWLATVLVPACGGLYFGLSQIWGFPKGEEVIGTITVFDTFIGLVLVASARSYNKSEAKYDGDIEVETRPHEDGEVKTFSLALNSDPTEIDQKKELTFRVKPS